MAHERRPRGLMQDEGVIALWREGIAKGERLPFDQVLVVQKTENLGTRAYLGGAPDHDDGTKSTFSVTEGGDRLPAVIPSWGHDDAFAGFHGSHRITVTILTSGEWTYVVSKPVVREPAKKLILINRGGQGGEWPFSKRRAKKLERKGFRFVEPGSTPVHLPKASIPEDF